MNKKILYILLVVLIFSNYSKAQSSSGMYIGDESMYVPAGATMCSPYDVFIKNGSSFKLDGNIYFNNISNVELPSFILGTGSLYFGGNSNVALRGTDVSLYSLFLDLNGANLECYANVILRNKINLKSGKIEMKDARLLTIDNSNANAIELNDASRNNSSYVLGKLKRNVVAGTNDYMFPIGTASAYFPFILNNASANAAFTVEHRPDLYNEWSVYQAASNISLLSNSAWLVESDSEATFNPAMVNPNSSNGYDIVYSTNSTTNTNYKIYYNTSLYKDMFTLNTENIKKGLFMLSNDTKVKEPLVNTIYVGGTGETIFRVNNLANYQKVSLRVYNIKGEVVFVKDAYDNSFDASYFSSGTYYYYIDYYNFDGSVDSDSNIIEIIREDA